MKNVENTQRKSKQIKMQTNYKDLQKSRDKNELIPWLIRN